jgi:hypothetical protein
VGAVQLSDSTSTTSSVLASTPTATKSAYDLADTANTTATAAIPKSTVTTAGDVIYATGSAAVTRLGIGTAGQVLQVNSGATAPEWKTPAGGGKVLQVVNATTSTSTSNSTTTFADTTLTATITPTLASSKILVLVSQNGVLKSNAAATWLELRLLRGATVIADLETRAGSNESGSTNNGIGSISTNYLDTPATTSATTYKTQFRTGTSGNVSVQIVSSVSTITLLEIGA